MKAVYTGHGMLVSFGGPIIHTIEHSKYYLAKDATVLPVKKLIVVAENGNAAEFLGVGLKLAFVNPEKFSCAVDNLEEVGQFVNEELVE